MKKQHGKKQETAKRLKLERLTIAQLSGVAGGGVVVPACGSNSHNNITCAKITCLVI